MPRQARIVVPGLPHHITRHGINGLGAFFTDDDRRFYLRVLADQCLTFDVAVVGYCLMPDHVHLIAIPRLQSSLAKAIGSAHLRYTRYVNRVHGRSGHLWHDRFYSCPIDPEHHLAALRYVERNPIRAGLVGVAMRYPWSSAAAHDVGKDATELLDLKTWRRWTRPGRWRRFVRDPDDAGFIGSIRYQTLTGRPLGGDRFIARLEKKLNRRIRPGPMGRPRKKRTRPGASRRLRES